MAPDTRIRYKVDVTPESKTKVESLKGQARRAGDEAYIPKEDADKLVNGGFADYLDERGNVMSEKNVRMHDTPAEGEALKGKAKTVPEEERAQPGEYSSPEELEEAEEEASNKRSKGRGR